MNFPSELQKWHVRGSRTFGNDNNNNNNDNYNDNNDNNNNDNRRPGVLI